MRSRTDQSQDWGNLNFMKGYYVAWIGSSLTLVPARSADEAREAVAKRLGIDGGKWTKAYKRIPRRPELIARIVVRPACREDIEAWQRLTEESSATYRRTVTARLREERRACSGSIPEVGSMEQTKLRRDPGVTERDALVRLCDAAAQLREQGFADGKRWGKLYEVSALVHGIRANILAEP